MKITQKDVDYVARLARMHISDEQKETLTGDMAAIINIADKLNEIDKNGVIPLALAINASNVFRSDEIKPSYSRDELLKNAPEANAGCYSVPKIVE